MESQLERIIDSELLVVRWGFQRTLLPLSITLLLRNTSYRSWPYSTSNLPWGTSGRLLAYKVCPMDAAFMRSFPNRTSNVSFLVAWRSVVAVRHLKADLMSEHERILLHQAQRKRWTLCPVLMAQTSWFQPLSLHYTNQNSRGSFCPLNGLNPLYWYYIVLTVFSFTPEHDPTDSLLYLFHKLLWQKSGGWCHS